ncbi:site-specific integrase [Glutamicibacter endophyticus]
MKPMANDIYRRCGCRGAEGKQYRPLPARPTDNDKARACPEMRDPKHGSWGFYVAAGKDPRTGKRVQHRKAGYPTEKAARVARNKVAASVDNGTYTPPSKVTVEQYLAEWLPRRQRTGNGLKPTTVSNYRRYIENDITGSIVGAQRITELRRDHVQRFVDQLMDEKRGAVTIRRIIAVLKAAFRYAVRDGYMSANVASDVDLPTVEKKPVTVWAASELQSFLSEASKHRLGDLFQLVVRTGLRRGEVLGLRWDDVDFVEPKLTIRRTRVEVKGVAVEQDSTKTDASMSSVELDTAAVDVLMRWKIRQDTERDVYGDCWEGEGHVFTLPDGSPLNPSYVTKLFTTIRKAAKAPALTFHGLRHEHAALLAQADVDVMVISKRLRHSNIGVTNDFYGHMLPNVSRNAASKVSQLIDAELAPVHTLHTSEGVSGMKNAPAETTNGSDKGVPLSPLPDSNRRPAVYKTAALAS